MVMGDDLITLAGITGVPRSVPWLILLRIRRSADHPSFRAFSAQRDRWLFSPHMRCDLLATGSSITLRAVVDFAGRQFFRSHWPALPDRLRALGMGTSVWWPSINLPLSHRQWPFRHRARPGRDERDWLPAYERFRHYGSLQWRRRAVEWMPLTVRSFSWQAIARRLRVTACTRRYRAGGIPRSIGSPAVEGALGRIALGSDANLNAVRDVWFHLEGSPKRDREAGWWMFP
jgi:hypothetical protein